MTEAKSKVRPARMAMGAIGAVIAICGVAEPLISHETDTIAAHHLLHAGMAAGAGLLALSLPAVRLDRERTFWIWPAVIAPAIGLLLMWPTEYAYITLHPWLHFLDHLGIALITLLAVYAAQAYVRGLGWLMLFLVVAMDAACAGGYGVSPGPSFLLRSSQPGAVAMPVTHTNKPSGKTTTLHAIGAKLYATMGCVGCHSVDGSKGVGPSWKNLTGYPQKLTSGKTVIADYKFLRTMILDPGRIDVAGYPRGVMPDSYKKLLSGPKHPHETKLNAIIWYINTLSNRAGKGSEPPVPDRTSP